MKFDLSNVEFSRNDINEKIKIPENLTKKLSYLIGVHIGDGCMNYYQERYYYSFQYDGHLIDEEEFYQNKIALLIEDIFNKKPSIIKYKRDTSIRLYFGSKAIFTFLNRVVKLEKSPKINVCIPKIILLDDNTKINFLRGLADTDFSLVFKKKSKSKHSYPVISYGTPDKSLITQVYGITKELGLNVFLGMNYKRERNGTKLTTNNLEINGTKNLEKWMRLIGFNSPKHITKYQIWKRYGFCPSGTNIIDRYKILNGEIDINEFHKA